MMRILCLVLVFASYSFATLPLCDINGKIAWDNGLRYVCNTGTPNRWSPATTNWMTTTKNATFTLDAQGREVLHLTSGSFTINLSATAVLGNGFSFAVKNTDGGTITIDPNSTELIEGASTFTINTTNSVVEFVTDGTAWYLLTEHGQLEYWTRDSVTETISNTPVSKLAITSLLDDAVGNEQAMVINYTTNKAGGSDTGLRLNYTDTASPVTSMFIDGYNGANRFFYVSSVGAMGVASVSSYGSTTNLVLNGNTSATTTGNAISISMPSAKTNASGNWNTLSIASSYDQTASTASNTDLLINRTETAVGTGNQRLIDAQVGTVTKFNVDNKGTITNTGGFISNVTNVNSATYNILISDYILSVSYTGTGAVTNLQLMTATCVNGRRYVIKDSGGNAGANTITVQTEGAEKIDGQDTYTINNNYGAVSVYCYGSNWFIY